MSDRMEELILIEPKLEYEKQAREYVNEFNEENVSEIPGGSGIEKYSYIEWLKKLELGKRKETVVENRVPAHTYFLLRTMDNNVLGVINIRHELNDYLLREGGHIGYSIKKSERQKGYATKLLELGLEKCFELGIDNALVTCDKNNIGSSKTIQNNLGVLENEYQSEDGITLRYWIDVKETLNKEKSK